MTPPATMQQALDEAGRKARGRRIGANERDQIVAQLKREPLPTVRRNTGLSLITLCRIAEVAGL